MIIGKHSNLLKKLLTFWWGDSKISIKSTYKYLGTHFSDKYPRADCWGYNCDKKGSSINIAYHRCSTFLTNKTIPIHWRLSNFSAMIAPMFGYDSAIWWLTKSMHDKLEMSYMSKLKYTVGCGGSTNQQLLLLLCNIHGMDYWHELNKVVFKYKITLT